MLLASCTAPHETEKTDPRVESLLQQMTLDEKIGQMVQVDSSAFRDRADVRNYFLGSVLSGGDSDPANGDNSVAAWLAMVTDFQSWSQRTRLKIPILYGIDTVHGHNNILGAVIFPHNIGMGATHNPSLVTAEERVTAEEMRGTGISWGFAPCIAVAENERWGRTYESFGTGPELTAKLAAAAVRGFQGEDLAGPTSVLACAKHFIGDGGTLDGKDQGDDVCDEVTLRKQYLQPYAAAVKAGVGSIMVSFSSWNGKKMSANQYLLTTVLKGELGFQGFLVSDWAAIDQISPDYKQDIAISVNAGLDMFMIPNGPDKPNNYVEFIQDLKNLVAAGTVPQTRIDDAVRRILRIKFAMGLFSAGPVDPGLTAAIGSREHRQVARECVSQSLVLLKNDRATLPLAKNIRHLHVAGTAADDLGVQCGGWTIGWQGTGGNVTPGGTTMLAAIRQTVSPATQVTTSADGTVPPGTDAVVVVLGEKPYAEGPGDKADLNLDDSQRQVIARAKQAGVPVITLLISGRPLVLGSALDQSDALVAAWLPGTEGQGVADALFGDHAFTGTLPRAWPRNSDQADSLKLTDPLFSVGYGLKR
jgi:beta-glucosidase